MFHGNFMSPEIHCNTSLVILHAACWSTIIYVKIINKQKITSDFVADTVPAGGLALLGAKSSEGTVMTKLWLCIITQPLTHWPLGDLNVILKM